MHKRNHNKLLLSVNKIVHTVQDSVKLVHTVQDSVKLVHTVQDSVKPFNVGLSACVMITSLEPCISHQVKGPRLDPLLTVITGTLLSLARILDPKQNICCAQNPIKVTFSSSNLHDLKNFELQKTASLLSHPTMGEPQGFS